MKRPDKIDDGVLHNYGFRKYPWKCVWLLPKRWWRWHATCQRAATHQGNGKLLCRKHAEQFCREEGK